MNFIDSFYEKMNDDDIYATFVPSSGFQEINNNKLIVVEFENILFRLNFTTFELDVFADEEVNQSKIFESEIIQKTIKVLTSMLKEYKLKTIF
jgi:hypothetical protein